MHTIIHTGEILMLSVNSNANICKALQHLFLMKRSQSFPRKEQDVNVNVNVKPSALVTPEGVYQSIVKLIVKKSQRKINQSVNPVHPLDINLCTMQCQTDRCSETRSTARQLS